MTSYLTPHGLKELCDPETGGFACTIKGIQVETINGRPHIVLYVEEDARGIVLTRALYDDLVPLLGRSPQIEEFFQTWGRLH
jgi:hypothetical protein